MQHILSSVHDSHEVSWTYYCQWKFSILWMQQISQLSSWLSRSELDFFQIFNFVNATDFSAQFVILTKWAELINANFAILMWA